MESENARARDDAGKYIAYGRYRSYRDAAWYCLYDYEIDRLPVDVRGIAARAGIRVLADSAVHVLRPQEKGVAVWDGVRWSIVYDDAQTVETCRYVIAHELGHIFMGHGMERGATDQTVAEQLARAERTPTHEREADHFAIRLLCPACMLWALDLHTAEEIAAVCLVPVTVAKPRARRMTTLYQRNCFLQSELERRVFERFKPYIDGERKRYGLPPFDVDAAKCFE